MLKRNNTYLVPTLDLSSIKNVFKYSLKFRERENGIIISRRVLKKKSDERKFAIYLHPLKVLFACFILLLFVGELLFVAFLRIISSGKPFTLQQIFFLVNFTLPQKKKKKELCEIKLDFAFILAAERMKNVVLSSYKISFRYVCKRTITGTDGCISFLYICGKL